MNLFSGISYNLRGLKMGLATPRLLALGMLRFVAVILLTALAAVYILSVYQEVLGAIWARPESAWLIWLWHLASWLLGLLLLGLSAVVTFFAAQILFAVVIMDLMSRITERRIAGQEQGASDASWGATFLFLVRQEIPRAVIPVALALGLMLIGWLTPLAPVITLLSSLAAAVFLAWDNTDLVPARRMAPFRSRFRFLMRHLLFHLGFGLLFLVPIANILFLSFAPVGATLWYVERIDGSPAP